jgi:hypothetical protein
MQCGDIEIAVTQGEDEIAWPSQATELVTLASKYVALFQIQTRPPRVNPKGDKRPKIFQSPRLLR